MAEIEIGIMSRQALAKPLPDLESFKRQVRIWTIKRNSECRKINWQFTTADARACLKNHSYHLHNDAKASYLPLCVIFASNSVDVARYAAFIWHKSPTNCDAHLAESIFQTRSRIKLARLYPKIV